MLPDALVTRVEQQEWRHTDLTVLSATHCVSRDGGHTCSAEPTFDAARIVGVAAASKVGV